MQTWNVFQMVNLENLWPVLQISWVLKHPPPPQQRLCFMASCCGARREGRRRREEKGPGSKLSCVECKVNETTVRFDILVKWREDVYRCGAGIRDVKFQTVCRHFLAHCHDNHSRKHPLTTCTSPECKAEKRWWTLHVNQQLVPKRFDKLLPVGNAVTMREYCDVEVFRAGLWSILTWDHTSNET